jgi:hypothetical protein
VSGLSKNGHKGDRQGTSKCVSEYNSIMQQASPKMNNSLCNLGLGFVPKDSFLLLSTGRKHTSQLLLNDCGAGGQLLDRIGDPASNEEGNNPMMHLLCQGQQPNNLNS